MMNKVIPILPCPDIRVQVEFYQQLGFELMGLYTSPNPYAVVQLEAIELHFYGSKKMVPTENATMCYVQVEDVDAVCDAFSSGLKKHTGKVARSGIPRISKVRDLSSDRRFTLTDPGGNTLYVGTPANAEANVFFRTLHNEAAAKKFAVLYDLIYSKEDCLTAANLLPQLMAAKDTLDDLDKAKLLLAALEIQRQLRQSVDEQELQALIDAQTEGGSDWEKVRQRRLAILQDE